MSNQKRINLENNKTMEITTYPALVKEIYDGNVQEVRDFLRMVDLKNDVFSLGIWENSYRLDNSIEYMAPLNIAIRCNSPKMVRLLNEFGASPCEYPKPHHSYYDYLEYFEYFEEYGCCDCCGCFEYCKHYEYYDGIMTPPLLDAIKYDCDKEIIKYLIEVHPDPYFQSQKMFTNLLGTVCSTGNVELVECMIETKPKISTYNYEINSVLFGSKESNKAPDIYKNKIKPIDRKDVRGMTPLMYAAKNGHFFTVNYLISKGANIEIKSKKGKTAYYYGNKSKNTKLIQFLRDVYEKKFPDLMV